MSPTVGDMAWLAIAELYYEPLARCERDQKLNFSLGLFAHHFIIFELQKLKFHTESDAYIGMQNFIIVGECFQISL